MAPALALPPSEGTGTLFGHVAGRRGNRVRLVYRRMAQIIERGNGWEAGRAGPNIAVRLDSQGRFSVPVPGCPAAMRAIGCSGTAYEAWATYNGKLCSTAALIMNVTSGEGNEVAWLNPQPNPPRLEALLCSASTANKH